MIGILWSLLIKIDADNATLTNASEAIGQANNLFQTCSKIDMMMQDKLDALQAALGKQPNSVPDAVPNSDKTSFSKMAFELTTSAISLTRLLGGSPDYKQSIASIQDSTRGFVDQLKDLESTDSEDDTEFIHARMDHIRDKAKQISDQLQEERETLLS
ncbi:MAG: hypothetical protein ACRD3W_14745, partial [Terriglobales bacterium]